MAFPQPTRLQATAGHRRSPQDWNPQSLDFQHDED